MKWRELVLYLWVGLVQCSQAGQKHHQLQNQHISTALNSFFPTPHATDDSPRTAQVQSQALDPSGHPDKQLSPGSKHLDTQDTASSPSGTQDAHRQEQEHISSSGRSLQQVYPELSDDDFVVAIPGCISRLKVAQSTRAWRNNLHTAIVLNDSQVASQLDQVATSKGDDREAYLMWPDEPRTPGATVGQGEVRAALAPILAHRLFTTDDKHRHEYKWMLYGDDDTLFFMDNIKRMLKDYDHSQPMVISDNIWYAHKHHNFEAPRCLPCHLKTPEAEAQLLNTTAARTGGYVPPWGCPYCTSNMTCKQASTAPATRWWEDKARSEAAAQKQALSTGKNQTGGARMLSAAADQTLDTHEAGDGSGSSDVEVQVAAGLSTVGRELKARPKPPPKACHHAVAHGGAGIIISRALFDRLDLEKFIRCVQTHKGCAGGDCRFGVCLREVAGLGFTDPGHSVFSNNNHFKTVFDNEQARVIKRSPSEALARGLCDEVCLWQVQNAISTHIKARSHASFSRACAYMYAQALSHQAAQKYLRFIVSRHQVPTADQDQQK